MKIYENKDVKRIIAFIPPKHLHTRLYVEFKDQSIVIQEATLAAILRAYINVAQHPIKRAYELESVKVKDRKPGYSEYQLIESGRDEEEVLKEVLGLSREQL